MIVTIANTKGGTGKTTAALQIALYLRTVENRKVWLVDADSQESALTAVSIRSDAGVQPALPCSSYGDGRTLYAQLMAQKDIWEDIIVDVGGRDTDALRAALTVTDLLVIPVRPRSLDIWAISKMMSLIEEAGILGCEFKVLAFLSNADAQGTDNRDAAEQLKAIDKLQFIDTPIGQRKAFTTACSQGLCVTEIKPKDAKAITELKHLVAAIRKYGEAEK